MTEGTFFHDPLRPNGDIPVQGLPHLLWPSRLIPVEESDGIRTSRRTIPTPDTTRKDLGHEPLGVPVGRIDRTDLYTRRFVAMHARPWDESGPDMRILPLEKGNDLYPVDRSSHGCLCGADDRHVVFCFTGNDASLASRASV